jgi:hypothetical protein
MTPPASPGLEPALEASAESSALVDSARRAALDDSTRRAVLDDSARRAALVDAPRARLSTGAVLVACVTWAPVGLSAALLVHIALLGLAPALAESHRLERAHDDQNARLAAARAEAAELGALQRALNDPIYLERERQALRVSPEGAQAVPASSDVPNSGLSASAAQATVDGAPTSSQVAAPLAGAAH